MRNWKRFAAASLCAGMMLTASITVWSMPATVCAEEELKTSSALSGTCGAGVTWEYSQTAGILTISGNGAMDDWDSLYDVPWVQSYLYYNTMPRYVVIGKGITHIGANAFAGHALVSSITIPDTVTSIGTMAFLKCDALTSITLPDSVKTLDTGAFFHCESLSEVNLGNGLQSIGIMAFGQCNALKKITLPGSLQDLQPGAFILCPALEEIQTSQDNPIYTSVDGILFSKDLKTLVKYPPNKPGSAYTVPDTVDSILEMVECTNLKDITIPECVEYYTEHSFDLYDLENKEYIRRTDLTLHVISGSCAEHYAQEKGIRYEVIQSETEQPTEPKPDLAEPYFAGDVTGDGIINAMDATMVLVAASRAGTAGENGLNAQEQNAADVNEDKAINAKDATAILRYAAAAGLGDAGSIRDYT